MGLSLAGSAAAAPAPHRQSSIGRDLQTLISGLRVRAAATSKSDVTGRLGSAAGRVSIACWTTGTPYGGSPIWYRISLPFSGYVPAFAVAAHFAPAIGVPHCAEPRFQRQYLSIEPSLHVRERASASAAITGSLGTIGARLTVDCRVTGDQVLGDPVWYHVVFPVAGYVTGRYLNTGGDPDPGVPPC